jgi:hypothetical protein
MVIPLVDVVGETKKGRPGSSRVARVASDGGLASRVHHQTRSPRMPSLALCGAASHQQAVCQASLAANAYGKSREADGDPGLDVSLGAQCCLVFDQIELAA